MYYVFVYGTLKQDFPNHHLLAGAKRAVDCPAVLEGFEMYSVDSRYPAVVRGKGKIYGEIYVVKDFNALDQLQSNGRLYQRMKVPAWLPANQQIDLWIYLFLRPVDQLERVPSGEWVS